MKVLSFLTSISLRTGGPSRSVPMLVRGLAEAGVDITLMTVYSEDMNTHALEGTSAKLKVLKRDYTQNEVEEFVASEKFDIIQVQSMWDLRYHNMKKIADKYHIPYIVTPRGMLEPWSLSQKKWKKKLALWLYQLKDLKTSVCIFTTAEMEAQNVRKLGVNVPIAVIPNGISTEGYTCRKSMDKVKKQVLFLSRIHEKKGIEILVDVWEQLIPQFPDWNLVIAGNGEEVYINQLKDLVSQKSLNGSVQIIPPVFGEEKLDLYQTSSLFVLPSYSENFGMVIAEAMSCGVPAVTTKFTPWNLLNGNMVSMGVQAKEKTGWCIELSKEELEKAMREAMSMSAQELYDMGQKASLLIKENFDYRSVAKKTKDLYCWILGEGNKPNFIY